MLTPGEFVMRKEAVKKYGANTFAGMNAAGAAGSVSNNTDNRTNTIIENLINNRSRNKTINTIRQYKKGGLVQHFNEGGLVEKYKNIAGEKYDPKDPTTIQKTVNELKNQMMSVSSRTIKTVKNVSPTIIKSMGKNMVPVAVPIKVKAISKTTVLPAIEKQKTSQPTRPGTTVPVFNINSDSTVRSVTLISLGVEETL
jgi:hypothetical protein